MSNEEKQLQKSDRSSGSSQQSQQQQQLMMMMMMSSSNQLENIKVAVRLRPFTEKEKQRRNRRILDIEQNTVILFNPRYGDTSLKQFTFDHSYWSHDGFKKDPNGVNVPDPDHQNGSKYVGQEEVFKDLGTFLLKNALEGYNSALLAYGQTGSGKSYTVSGYGHNEGILPRFARALFQDLNKKSIAKRSLQRSASIVSYDGQGEEPSDSSNNRYEVLFSMYEIYNEVVRDLLGKNNADVTGQTALARRGLKVREHPKHGFFVENLTSLSCADKDELERRIEEGQLNKSIAATSMNETSSRGHTIYEFRIKQYKLKSLQSSDEILTTSMVQIVDLAGSERLAVHVGGQLGENSFIASRSNSPYPKPRARSRRSKGISSASPSVGSTSGPTVGENHHQRFKESVSINQSLSALGNCIQVMSQYSQQLELANAATAASTSKKSGPKIPYRDSVLTKLLNRCCLSGTSKVAIIATLSPVDTNYDDTLSTLRFADRAKQIRVHAKVNQMSRSEFLDNIQRENEQLKLKMAEGRLTRSDDSSQTSNFDETENPVDNFKGPKSCSSRAERNIDTIATPSRSRTSTRKSKGNSDRSVESRLGSSTSNPALIVKEQMKRLVSPATRKFTNNYDASGSSIRKSKSISYGLSGAKLSIMNQNLATARDADGNAEQKQQKQFESGEEDLEEIELEMDEIKEGLISPESEEDSFEDTATDEMSNEEKISLVNKLLSNSVIGKENQKHHQSLHNVNKSPNKNKLTRPKKANRTRAGLKQVSLMSFSLKKSNPYLSNLNMDEQLTGLISYLIKTGETILGKSGDCDVVFRGTELRGHHARITRLPNDEESQHSNSKVFIEPILNESIERETSNIALRVNGSTVTSKTQLNHNDRILFGTNSYFVYIDNESLDTSNEINFDMAQNEVLEKMMAEDKNEAMIKEIKDYTHRPGTGKHSRAKQQEATESREPKDSQVPKPSPRKKKNNLNGDARLARSITIQDHSDARDDDYHGEKDPIGESADQDEDLSMQENSYRGQLMEDTYEYALPVTEVNAVAKEMDIKVTYELKILTGEEQLPEYTNLSFVDQSNNSTDGFSSSSIGGDSSENKRVKSMEDDQVTTLSKLDALDVPPALFIKVHLDEHNIDFYWSKEKFQGRRYKILELYGPWEIGGKSGLVEHLIDQSKTQGDYLIDPFIDNVNSSLFLIGHAQISLQPISHLTDINQSYDILDMNDETLGTINVQAIPCHINDDYKSQETETRESDDPNSKEAPFRLFNDEELEKSFLSDPRELLGKKLVFLLKVISCHDIPEKYTNVFCQYTLSSDKSSIRTAIQRDSDSSEVNEQLNSELLFNHSHYIRFESVTQDILDFFDHGFLIIQVVGQQKLSDKANRSLTIVSTIIDSINRYKYKLEQGSYNGMNPYPYYNSNPDSARSNGGPLSGVMNSGSGASSVASTSATVNLFDQQNEEEEAISSINGLSQENIIDMILTKRKLDRAENQLHYLKRTVNIAEHYNKKHIPIKTVKMLLNSYGHELDDGSLEEMSADVKVKEKATENKHSACAIQ